MNTIFSISGESGCDKCRKKARLFRNNRTRKWLCKDCHPLNRTCPSCGGHSHYKKWCIHCSGTGKVILSNGGKKMKVLEKELLK